MTLTQRFRRFRHLLFVHDPFRKYDSERAISNVYAKTPHALHYFERRFSIQGYFQCVRLACSRKVRKGVACRFPWRHLWRMWLKHSWAWRISYHLTERGCPILFCSPLIDRPHSVSKTVCCNLMCSGNSHTLVHSMHRLPPLVVNAHSSGHRAPTKRSRPLFLLLDRTI